MAACSGCFEDAAHPVAKTGAVLLRPGFDVTRQHATRSADETAPRVKSGPVPLRVRQLADAHRLPDDIAVHVVDLLLAQAGVGIAIGSGRCGSDRGRAEDAEPDRCRSPAIAAPINVAGPPIAVAHHRTATIDTAAIATAAIAAALGVGGLGRDRQKSRGRGCFTYLIVEPFDG